MRLNVLALTWAAASAPAASSSDEPNSASTGTGITLDEVQLQANANILAILDKRHEDLTLLGVVQIRIGVFAPNRSDVILISLGLASLDLKPGLGGGCIYNGPFINHTVNLGPISSGTTGVDGGLGYDPRCLSRDINPYTAARFLTWSDILFIMSQTNIYDFQMNLQGIPGIGIGAHGGGHYTVGNDMSDLFSSPNDPAFFVHGQVDRVWTIWQWLDPVNRTYTLAQTNTYLNSPPSANTTLNDPVQLGFAGGETKEIGQLMSVIDEEFCYIYV